MILSDAWIFPEGPNWPEFSIVLKERQVRDLERIVESYEGSYEAMGRAARLASDTYFAEDVYFDYVVESCLRILDRQVIPEHLYWKLNPAIIAAWKFKDTIVERAYKVRGRVRLRTRLRRVIGGRNSV